MKACLMRVNYDPRYTTSSHTSSLQSRLAVTRDIYGSGAGINVQKTLKDTLEEAAARKKARQRLLQTLGAKTPDKDKDTESLVTIHSRHHHRREESNSSVGSLRITEPLDEALDSVSDSLMLPMSKGWCEDEPNRARKREEKDEEGRRRNRSRHDQHKEGVAAAHSSLRQSNMKSTTPPVEKAPSDRTPSSYGERLLKRQQSINALTVQARNRYASPSKQIGVSHDHALSYYNRSRTVGSFGEILSKKSPAKIELEKRARREAEKAIKDRKVFTIMGPYHSLRQALRRRGWVERFNNAPPPGELGTKRRPLMNTSDSDDDDGNDRHHKENITPPWEEENGFYGMMSYLTRNCTPSLVFAVKTVDVETRKGGQLVNHFGKARHFTTKSQAVQRVRPTLIFAVRSLDVESRSRHQIVNHYARANNFTTKLGLCQNLREVPWYENADPDEFYPRCHKLEDEEERQAFIEDFHMTAAVSFIKWFVEKYDGITVEDEDENKKSLNAIVTSMMSTTQALGNETVESVSGTTPRSEAAPEVRSGTGGNVEPVPISSSRPVSATAETNNSLDQNKPLHVASDLKHGSHEKNGKVASSKRKSSLPPVLSTRGVSALSHCTTTTTATSITAANSSPPGSPAGSVMGRFLYHRSGKTMKAKYYHIAVRQCEQFIKAKEHEDIDVLSNSDDLTDAQWDQFLSWYYTFVHEDADFMKVTGAMVRYCKVLLEKIKSFSPQYILDGFRNVWIIKPGAKSRGRGIQCADRLDKILGMVGDNDDKLVAQKYIERPFLVYNTKFDIRQWFLVTDWQPLTIWFYKSCYLRFCTQNFTLENFHENQGHGNIWKEVVVPGMKSALTCALLCTQELVEVRKSAFELYGADFMLTDDLQPWLIEINSSPSMARNTRATCKLVDAVLEDTLKVVLDRRRDKTADTGEFECILRQNYISDPRPPDSDLTISGRKIRKKHYSYTPHKGPVQR